MKKLNRCPDVREDVIFRALAKEWKGVALKEAKSKGVAKTKLERELITLEHYIQKRESELQSTQ